MKVPFKYSSMYAILSMILVPASAQAYQVMDFKTDAGHHLFSFEIYDKAGEKTNDEDAAFDLTEAELQSIRYAGNYWTKMLEHNTKNENPVRIDVSTLPIAEHTAWAWSPFNKEGTYTEVHNQLVNNVKPEDVAGLIRLGERGYLGDLEAAVHMDEVNKSNWNITSTMSHEIGHAVGIASRARGSFDNKTNQWNFRHFDDNLAAWDKNLVDSRGKKAAPNLQLEVADTAKDCKADTFCATKDSFIFFQGAKVMELLDGATFRHKEGLNNDRIGGLAIRGYEKRPEWDSSGNKGWFEFLDMSHTESKASVMSHQRYNNHNLFQEVELAMMEDLGYKVDRRNFYGRSVYKDDQTIVNKDGYFARDAEGTKYLVGQYSQVLGGIGLHIYGDRNTVTQKADVLSEGFGAAGMRIDGEANKIIVDNGVKLHANGEKGAGILVTYGRNHQVVNKGEIHATGKEGIAVAFDFGDSGLGNGEEYRGSWMYKASERTPEAPTIDDVPELHGPLVKQFDVYGSLKGGKNSIFISQNALVDNINVKPGARIEGDIESKWNPFFNVTYRDHSQKIDAKIEVLKLTDEEKEKARTTLAFGDSNASSKDQMLLKGNIIGREGFNVVLNKGQLNFSGNMNVHRLDMRPDAVLAIPLTGNTEINVKKEVTLAKGSRIKLTDGFISFNETTPLNELTALTLTSYGHLNNQSNLDSNVAKAGYGIYDYQYNTRWNQTKDKVLASLNTLSSKSINRQRAAIDVITAPLVIASKDKSTEYINKHMTNNLLNRTVDHKVNHQIAEDLNQEGHSIWAVVGHNRSNLKTDSDTKLHSSDLSLGADYSINDNAFIGLAFHTSTPKYKTDSSTVKSTGYGTSIYGGIIATPLNLELSTVLGLGVNSNKEERTVHSEFVKGQNRNHHYRLGLSLGKTIVLTKDSFLRPFAEYEYNHTKVKGFNENNSTFALKFGETKHSINRFNLGTDAAFKLGEKTQLATKVYYSGLTSSNKKAPITFVNDPAQNKYAVNSDKLDKNSVGVNFSIDMALAKRVNLSTGYGLLKGKNITEHQFNIDLSAKF